MIQDRDDEIDRLGKQQRKFAIKLEEFKEREEESNLKFKMMQKELEKFNDENAKLRRRLINVMHTVKV